MTAEITPLRPNQTVTESDAAALQLTSYVMHIRSHQCAHCQSGAEWSELYEVWTHPTKTSLSALNVLRPTATLHGGMEIVYISLSIKTVPICSECVAGITTDDLPRPLPAASRSSWADTIKRKALDAVEAARSAPRQTHTPKLEDL